MPLVEVENRIIIMLMIESGDGDSLKRDVDSLYMASVVDEAVLAHQRAKDHLMAVTHDKDSSSRQIAEAADREEYWFRYSRTARLNDLKFELSILDLEVQLTMEEVDDGRL